MKPAQARIALVGASGGIGRASARALLDAGASVMLVGRSPARLSGLARSLASRSASDPSRIAWHAADITSPIAIEALREKARDWRVNVLVLAAGVPSFGRFDGLDAAAMHAVIHTNLVAPIQVAQALLPGLRESPQSRIMVVGSTLGSIGMPGFSIYSASKFGLRGFAEALRRELGDTRVRVQYLGPRSTRTTFNGTGVEAYNRATRTATDPPEVVALALVRLLQGDAAEHFIGFPERLAVRLNALAPTLIDRAFAVHRRSLPESATAAVTRRAPASPPAGDRGPATPAACHSHLTDTRIKP